MSVYLKEGVLGTLTREMRRGHGRVADLYEKKGLHLLVTSRREGTHSNGSIHPDGNAEDFKRQGVLKAEIVGVLGSDFDVVEYGDARDIFHTEYDPK